MSYKDLKNKLDLIEKFYLNRNYVCKTEGEIPHALSPDEWEEVKEYEYLETLRDANKREYAELLAAWDEYYEAQKYSPAAFKKRYAIKCWIEGDKREVKRVANTSSPMLNLPQPSPYDPLWLRSGAHSVGKYKHLLERRKQLRIEIGVSDEAVETNFGSMFD